MAEQGLTDGLLGTGGTPPTDDPDNPQKKLQENGEIPDGFLRQMFYTLGDYRDICIGKTPDGIDTVSASDSGKDKDGETTKKKISDMIEDFLKKQPVTSSGQPGGKPGSHSVKTPQQTWWDKHAPSIWEGMVCALTYKESDEKGTDSKPPTQIDEVYKKFFGTQNGTYQSKYKYDRVELKEENSGEMKTNDDTIQPPTLKQFTSRPPYFRYLEEWGQNFCKERKKRLEEVKDNCREGRHGSRSNDGDGFDCEKKVTNKDVFLEDFNGSSCATCCSSYRKWIERKGKEFEEQSNAYKQQKQDAEGNNNGNEFSKTLDTYTTAGDFLENLKNGPCSKINSAEDNGNGNEEDKLNFRQPNVTFRPATDCKPCSLNELKCNSDVCGDGTKVKCNGETITADAIGKMDNSTVIDMLVSDNSIKEFEDDLDECLLPECANANIFEGFREDKWKCGKLCDYDVCILETFKEGTHDKKNVLIRTLFKRWLEYFFEDYNRIQKKLMPCMKNGKESTCQNKCDKKCECVKKWVEEKEKEWKTIRDRYLKPYDSDQSQIYFNVKSFLETLQPQTDVNKAIKPCPSLDEFERSSHCNGSASSENGVTNKKDIVECLLDKLETKATSCQTNHKPSAEPCTQTTSKTPSLDDEEDENPDPNQNT
ncbi:hypothetical protein PFTANZ_06627, partial [Plasmodium falciparum Tanzania (2000708)]